MESNEKKIKITQNGPYVVTGKIPLDQLAYIPNSKGASVGYKKIQNYPEAQTYALCRCGNSKNKPFCDGSHTKGFDGTETAGFKDYDDIAEVIEGEYIDLMDAKEFCAVARFCDTKGSTWRLVAEGGTPETADIAIEQCKNCPSGRLTAITKEGEKVEPKLNKEISTLEDTAAAAHGPIWVKGGIAVESENGKTYQIRNRVTLCRCGKSSNKPFCDASHMENQGELRY